MKATSSIFALTFLLLIFLAPQGARAANFTKTFYATDDASLVSDHPWDEYGNEPQMALSSSTSTGKVVNLVIRFDLASLPQGAEIRTASMNLYSAYCSGATDLLTVARLASDWSENTVNWNTVIAHTADRNYLLRDPVCSTSARWLNFYIDDIAKAWASGKPNNGVIVKLSGIENVNYLFASTESAESGQRPELIINYDYTDPAATEQESSQTSAPVSESSSSSSTTSSSANSSTSTSPSTSSGASTNSAANSAPGQSEETATSQTTGQSDTDLLKEIAEENKKNLAAKNPRLLILIEGAILLAIILTIVAYKNRSKIFKLKESNE